MGTWSLFTCHQCGYEAKVSGRPDMGMFVRTRTITCRDCKELYDVAVAKRSMDGPVGFRDVAPRCPRSETHSWEPWHSPGPCPRCGEIMDRGKGGVFWD
jgi:hypothetical protein